MNLNNYIKTVLSGVKTWALSTFANKRDFDELNSRMYYSEQVEKFFFKNQQISPMDSYGDYVNMSFLEKQCDDISIGDTLNVVWDGTEYECKVFYYDEALMIGNKSIVGTIMGESFVDTGEPFVISIWNGYEVGFYYTDMVSESHVISISGMVEKVHQIESKYVNLPMATEAKPGVVHPWINYEWGQEVWMNPRDGGLYTSYNYYELPVATSTRLGGVKVHGAISGNDYANRNFPIWIGSDNKLYVGGSICRGTGTNSIILGLTSGNTANEASGHQSVAIGSSAKASGRYSFTANNQTDASGDCSAAFGEYTCAGSKNQFVIGYGNVKDIDNQYIMIVGNYPADSKYAPTDDTRSNAHTIDWDGNAWFSGDVYVGGAQQDDIDAKKVVTTERLGDSYLVLADSVNGYEYIVQMNNGNLVSQCRCDHIEITSMPMKTEYMVGDAFDPAGMVITAVYQDGTTKIIDDYSFTKNIPSSGLIEIYYAKYGAVYHASPIAVSAVPFNPSIMLVDFDYTANDDGTYTLTGWKGTYQGVTSTEMIIPDNSLIIL